MTNNIFENSLECARRLDNEDDLKHFRSRFLIPRINGKEQIYFLGNSLGLQSKNTKDEIHKILDQWAEYGVEGFFMGSHPWMDYHDHLASSLSKIVGALPSEITVMNQLTVNLHLMMVSFYQPVGKRNKILCEAKAFPSDQYMFETHIRNHGFDPGEIMIEIKPREGEHLIRTEDIVATIEKNKEELCLVLFGGVNYYTGQAFDIKTITRAAHRIGAVAGFDLAHAAGNISLQLHDWNVDFACWCSYKYLNSGPGAVGGVYIHERFHNDKNIQRFGGWWGYDKATRFKMEKGFKPIPTAEGWQLSTPSLLLYASHKAALDIFEEAGWQNVQAKKNLLNHYLWFTLDEIAKSFSSKAPAWPAGRIEFITPRREEERGCQVSMLMHERGREIFDELAKQGVMADWREPNVIRIAPVPLYNTFEEVWRFGNMIKGILN
ncbi:MAG: kynureninase [Chitinophagales bacterium]